MVRALVRRCGPHKLVACFVDPAPLPSVDVDTQPWSTLANAVAELDRLGETMLLDVRAFTSMALLFPRARARSCSKVATSPLLRGIRFGAKMARSGVRGEREGRAEPAPSVSRATRDRTRPAIGPTCSSRLGGAAAAGRRRLLNSGWGLVRPPRRRIRWCGRRRRASAARYGVDFDTTPIETALNWSRGGVYLNGAYFPRARARRSRATRSASRPTRSSRLGGASPISFSRVLFRDFPSDVGQQSDPQSDRPAGAACWPPSPLLEFGLGAGAAAAAPDSLVWSAAPGERSEVRGRLRYHPDRNSTLNRSAEKGRRLP